MKIKIIPYPRLVEISDGKYIMPDASVVFSKKDTPVLQTAAQEIGAVLSTEKGNIIFKDLGDVPDELEKWAVRREGYGMEIYPVGITIWADSQAGYLYGAITLKQLIAQFGKELPCLLIGDAPVLEHRGVQIPFSQGMTEFRPDYFKHLVPILAGWKINALYLYLESYFKFPSFPYIAGPGAMTPDDAKDLDRLCSSYNIKLVPQVNLLGHAGEMLGLQRFHHLLEQDSQKDARINSSGYTLCTSSTDTRRLITSILDDIFSCFDSDIVHVGGDETGEMGECPQCRPELEAKGRLGFYADHFSWIKEMANKKGKKIGMWGDMLLKYFPKATPAQKQYTLEKLRYGCIIYDWHYSGGSPETLKYFSKYGFTTIACPSTNLCYTNSVDILEIDLHKALYGDAIDAGAYGGLTTAWMSFHGLHEEHMNYLHATGGSQMWAGCGDGAMDPSISNWKFEEAYCLQRYGMKDNKLVQMWHLLGDPEGPVTGSLGEYKGASLRKCLYHTDNVLTVWIHYGNILKGEVLQRYSEGLRQARLLWNEIQSADTVYDLYFELQEGPLLTHEHLLKRFAMIERMYGFYDKAAEEQFENNFSYKENLEAVVRELKGHLNDFPPVEEYLEKAHRLLGLEIASIIRLRNTKKNIGRLADFLEYLAEDERPLPAFVNLHEVFLKVPATNWFINRQHEWIAAPEQFQCYSIQEGPWDCSPWSFP